MDGLNYDTGGLYLGPLWECAEDDARIALKSCIDAFNWFEDLLWDLSPDHRIDFMSKERSVDPISVVTLGRLVDDAHAWAHRAGELVGGIFGCRMTHDGQDWQDECALSLMHVRLGNSVGMTTNYVCSICGVVCWDCDHEPGNNYFIIATRDEEVCNICRDAQEVCTHTVGSTYDKRAEPTMQVLELREISLVPRPRDPLARIKGRGIDETDLIDYFGFAPPSDANLLCHKCMYTCEGFRAGRYDEASELV
ncbi:hypothetical protein Pmi06nite_57430 [Planotetraspora mira]|uniref:Uncharacterized protein n=1 Tax=Planotetraspora mira TaxID=58121 RepID=A0A8J3X9D8_9ACTN|nr:hypothetical protein Pmi06nite_57430 [Planotetraspora mira]